MRRIVETLEAEGWKSVGIKTFRKGKSVIVLNAVTIALLDRFYNDGHKDGFERGAYEQMTQEDVEPTVRTLDPNGPEIPEWQPDI
jgi:hypothetical protein